MTSILLSIVALAMTPSAQAEDPVTGSGVVITETRKLAAFDEIEFRISGDIQITIGKPGVFQDVAHTHQPRLAARL